MKIVDGANNDIRIVGVVTILIMIIICAVGMEWEVQAQNALVAIIVVAIFNFIIGTIMGPQSDQIRAEGFEGLSGMFLCYFSFSIETFLDINFLI